MNKNCDDIDVNDDEYVSINYRCISRIRSRPTIARLSFGIRSRGLAHGCTVRIIARLLRSSSCLGGLQTAFFFSFIYRAFIISMKARSLIRFVRCEAPLAGNFHISRGLFLARRPEESHRCTAGSSVF